MVLTLNDAAGELGISPATLRQQIHAGRLAARKFGPIWVVSETELARYRMENIGRTGRPFVGRPGFVDTQHVRVRLFLAPADGRGHDAIWVQYLYESFVLDLELTNAKPFRPTRQTYEALDLLTDVPPGGRQFEFWNRQQVALEYGVEPHAVDLRVELDPYFPRPIVAFRDGPIWEAKQFTRYEAERRRSIDWSRPIE
jgi:hypothetical protein